jgi:hypothetical protein
VALRTASYTGFMAGNVQNGAHSYFTAGTYTSGWNFANRSGSFDRTNYSGSSGRGRRGDVSLARLTGPSRLAPVFMPALALGAARLAGC